MSQQHDEEQFLEEDDDHFQLSDSLSEESGIGFEERGEPERPCCEPRTIIITSSGWIVSLFLLAYIFGSTGPIPLRDYLHNNNGTSVTITPTIPPTTQLPFNPPPPSLPNSTNTTH